MTFRERLHELVDELPEDATAEAFVLISQLANPDDGQLSDVELKALREADAAIAPSQVRLLREARRDIGLRDCPSAPVGQRPGPAGALCFLAP